MNVSEAISKRRSVRSYTSTPVEPEKLELILQAARLSPSARNQQIWKFVVVRSKDTKENLVHVCDEHAFLAEADTVICCCAVKSDLVLPNGEATHTMDLAVAASFMMLQATELGLGSCWIGTFNEAKLKKLLRIPEEIRVVCLISLGYPHFVPPASDRKPLSEIVTIEHFAQPHQ
jgi:nitroreductase